MGRFASKITTPEDTMTDFIPETQQIAVCRREYEIALAKHHESMTTDTRDALGNAAAAWTCAAKAERKVEKGG